MRKYIILGWALLLMPLALQAAKVKIKFVDSDKKTLLNAESKLINKASGQETVAKANKKGEAEFDKVAVGEYEAHAHLKGYFLSSPETFTVSDKDVSLTLVLVDEKGFKGKEEEANQLLSQGKFKEAAVIYREMLKMTPNEAIIWSNLAKSAVGLLDQQTALEAAKKASTLDPKQFGDFEAKIQSWVNYEGGRRALESKDFPTAVKMLTESLKVEPNNPEGYYALALAYGHQKKYDEALKSIDEALKLKPDDKGFQDVRRILDHNAKISK